MRAASNLNATRDLSSTEGRLWALVHTHRSDIRVGILLQRMTHVPAATATTTSK